VLLANRKGTNVIVDRREGAIQATVSATRLGGLFLLVER
jgi:hypothetical protein